MSQVNRSKKEFLRRDVWGVCVHWRCMGIHPSASPLWRHCSMPSSRIYWCGGPIVFRSEASIATARICGSCNALSAYPLPRSRYRDRSLDTGHTCSESRRCLYRSRRILRQHDEAWRIFEMKSNRLLERSRFHVRTRGARSRTDSEQDRSEILLKQSVAPHSWKWRCCLNRCLKGQKVLVIFSFITCNFVAMTQIANCNYKE